MTELQKKAAELLRLRAELATLESAQRKADAAVYAASNNLNTLEREFREASKADVFLPNPAVTIGDQVVLATYAGVYYGSILKEQ